ncbi:uncharacterized protein LOC107039772 [Diachasma alloeum]|uniref:uncharacterized protein LOC107039772 n=1 Tax=Diachasma alloeum TaxID=454923 RepID=UPI0007383ADF|nr:uncharacterized protein LOC107039772 [Diachasma alloeum]
MFIRRRKYPELIEACAAVSLVCLIIVSASLATQEWTTATASVVDKVEGVKDSTVKYGLFAGTLIRRILDSPKSYDIYLTCLVNENVCAWSCLADADSREKELELLFNKEIPKFNCPSVSASRTLQSRLARDDNSTNTSTNGTYTGEFLNAGMFYSTLSAVIFTLITLFLLFVLSVVNCIMCPKDSTLNTAGMAILANVAFGANLLGVILYACNYSIWIKDNIGIRDTIVDEYRSTATLGYSFWIFMCTCFLIPLIAVFIFTRNGLLRQDRAETVIIVAQVNDPTTVLY